MSPSLSVHHVPRWEWALTRGVPVFLVETNKQLLDISGHTDIPTTDMQQQLVTP